MARSFTAASSHYLEYGSAILTAAPLTMACWARATGTGTSYEIMTLSRSSSTALFRLNFSNAAKLRALTQSTTATGIAVSSNSYSANTWHHCAAVYAGIADRTVYLDGTGVNETTSVTPVSIDRANIGCGWTGAARFGYLNGQVAEAAIWNVALTQDDIDILNRGVSPLLVLPDNLVAYWPLWGRAGPEQDLIGRQELTVTTPVYSDHPRIIYPRRRKIFLPGAASADGNASPSPIAAVWAIPAATIAGGADVAPSPIAGVWAMPAAAVAGAADVAPSPIAAVWAMPAASITGDATVAPAPIAAVWGLPAATLAGSAAVAPTPIGAVWGMPAPSVSGEGSANVAPDPIAAVWGMPAATLAAGATTAPSALAGTFAQPAPTVAGGATVTPSPVGAVWGMPSPTVEGQQHATVTPNPIAGVWTIHDPTTSGVVPFVDRGDLPRVGSRSYAWHAPARSRTWHAPGRVRTWRVRA